MRAVSLCCDKPSFLAVTQTDTEEPGGGNRALVKTQQLQGTSFSTYPRELPEKRWDFGQVLRDFSFSHQWLQVLVLGLGLGL